MKLRERYSSQNIRWNADQRQFKYESNIDTMVDEEVNEERYGGLRDGLPVETLNCRTISILFRT